MFKKSPFSGDFLVFCCIFIFFVLKYTQEVVCSVIKYAHKLAIFGQETLQ